MSIADSSQGNKHAVSTYMLAVHNEVRTSEDIILNP